MTSFDAQRADFTPYGLTCEAWRPTPMSRPDRHNEIELNLLSRGSVTYLLGGRKARLPARRLCAFWAAMPHQIIDYEPDTEYFVVTLPLAWFLQCRLPDELVQPLLQGQIVMEEDAAHAERDLAWLTQCRQDLHAAREELGKAVLLEIEARLTRLGIALASVAGAPSPSSSRALNQSGLSKVERMAALVARRYTEALTIDEIGRAVGLHPNYAMNLFKKTFGTTLIDYLTKHRVSHAQRLLATTDERILGIALASGFNSISRFNAAFQKECGCAPRQYRRQHRLEDRPAVRAAQTPRGFR